MKTINVKSFSVAMSLQVLTLACGPQDSSSGVQEAWNVSNTPNRISGTDMVETFASLPLSGEVKQKGWSDDYWPTFRGGIAHRWQTKDFSYELFDKTRGSETELKKLSPAEKFDIFMNRLDFPTVQDERRRTQVLKTVEGHPEYEEGYKIEAWEGLCHGWAPAAINFKEPITSVKVKSRTGTVEFYPSDIKALLMYYQQYSGNRSTRTSMVADRCNVQFSKLDEQFTKGEITQEQWQAARETNGCGDINAGTFHLILANEVGRKKESFVIDVTRDFEVWNQPVNSFKSEVRETTEGASSGAAAGTVREVRVDTEMSYTVETEPSRFAIGSAEKVANYSYVLELNADGNIIGGRWLSEERPDFAWRETTPQFRGYFAALKSLYEKSTAAHP